MCCFTFSLSANSFAQQEKVNLDLRDVSIKTLFSEIQRQTKLHFIFSNEQANRLDKLTVKATDETVKSVLDRIFEGTGFTYTFRDDIIMVRFEGEKTVQQVKKEVIIRGVVKDKHGESLPGVSVWLKGTTVGVATDVKGEFRLTVPMQDTIILRFTFIGMKPKDVVYDEKIKSMLVILEDNVTEMDEVVVTGYQEIKKERMTGAVEMITAKDIVNKGYTSVEEILKGTLAGVTTMSLSGRPGAQAEIRIRGVNSLTGSSDPMWIVDGMPLQGDVPEISMGGTEFQKTVLTSGIGNISPDDIESITVLKDAAATAVYGSRAANGVIVITTKRGTVGKSYINIQVSYAMSEAPENCLKMMNSKQKIAFERGIYADFPSLNLSGRVYQLLDNADQGIISRKDAELEIDKLGKVNTNWFDEIFRMARSQSYSATLSGGNEETQYYTSLFYSTQEGIVPNNKYDALSGSLKLTHDFNKSLRVIFNVSTSVRSDRSTASVLNPLVYATFANPYEQVYDENGDWAYDRSYTKVLSRLKDGYKYDVNIIKDLNENTSKTRYLSSQINLKLEYKIMKGLMASVMGIYSNSSSHYRSALNPGSYSSKYSSWVQNLYDENETPDYMNNGKMTESNSRSESWTERFQLTYARGFHGEDHYVNILAAQEVSSSKGFSFSSMIPEWSPVYGIATYPDLSGMKLNSSMSLASFGSHRESQDRSVSFFVTGSYSYKDRYVIFGSARWDGADIIGTANRFSPLWNVSAKWNIHNESFMQNLPLFNQLAFRFSYGYTGSIDRNALPFSRLVMYRTNYVYDGIKTVDEYVAANPSIKWQRTQDRSFGLDMSMLDNRLNIVVNYYNNVTRDLLDTKYLPSSTGFRSIVANVASLRNSGWEFSLKTLNIKTTDFNWTTSFNFAANKNVVLDTYYQSLDEISVNTNSTMESMYSLYVKGENVNSFYGYRYAGVDPATGGALAYVDGFNKKGERLGSLYKDGRYVINMDNSEITTTELHAARECLGVSHPPYTGGFSTSFTYKRLSLSASFTFMGGHKIRSFQSYTSNGNVYASSKNVLAMELNRWRKPGDITDIPKYETSRTSYLYDIYDFRFENGAFLKCNNVSFGYNVSRQLCQLLHISRARFNFNLSNLFTLTKYRGIDPENKGAFGYPSARRYNFTLSVGI